MIMMALETKIIEKTEMDRTAIELGDFVNLANPPTSKLQLLLVSMNTASRLGPQTHTQTVHLNPGPRKCYSTCWRRRYKKKGERGALVVNGHISNPRNRFLVVVPRPLPATPLVVHRRVLDRGAQAVTRGAARCASQVLGRGAQAVSRGTTRKMRSGTEQISPAFSEQWSGNPRGDVPSAISSR
jgi:hypothetical protein